MQIDVRRLRHSIKKVGASLLRVSLPHYKSCALYRAVLPAERVWLQPRRRGSAGKMLFNCQMSKSEGSQLIRGL